MSKNSNEFATLWATLGEIGPETPEIADVFGGGGSCAAAEISRGAAAKTPRIACTKAFVEYLLSWG